MRAAPSASRGETACSAFCSSSLLAPPATSSAPRRERAKTRVCTSLSTRSARIVPASLVAERRSGARAGGDGGLPGPPGEGGADRPGLAGRGAAQRAPGALRGAAPRTVPALPGILAEAARPAVLPTGHPAGRLTPPGRIAAAV